MNVHFRFDDRHQVSSDDFSRDIELLRHDVLDPSSVGLLDQRAHLRAEDAFRFGPAEQRSKVGHRLQQLHAVFFCAHTFVHFQKRHDAFHLPEIVRGRLPVDVPVHCVLEQDCAKNPVAGEARAGDDSRAHLMHERKHLCVIRPCTFRDPVRRAAAALIQRRNESGMRLHLVKRLFEVTLLPPLLS